MPQKHGDRGPERHPCGGLRRREFLKLAGAAGIGFAIPGSFDLLLGSANAATPLDLAVARGSSPSAIVRAAVEAMGGMGRFVSKGDVVVVKPNIGFDRVPEQAGCTNPEVVGEVVRLCMAAGAKKVKVFDRSVNDPRRCYVQSGIEPAAKAQGADVHFVDERRMKDAHIGGKVLTDWPLYGEVLDADKIINVPIAKHHGLAGLTMGIKNFMGVMGANRSRIHQRLDDCIVDLSLYLKPALTVLDAVRVLTANGPQGGNLKDVVKLDTVVVGTDQVAVDAYGATLFGLKGEDLGYVRIGAARGLGRSDLSKLTIRKISV